MRRYPGPRERVREMRRLAALALAGALVAIPAPAPAAQRGTIRGVIVDDAGKPAGRATVILTTLDAQGGDDSEQTSTDARGRFSFTGLSTGNGFAYAIDARYDGGLFPGGTLQLPDDTSSAPVFRTRLKVWRTTADPQSVLVHRDYLFVRPFEDTLSVIESVTIANTTDRAYVGRARSMGVSSNDTTPTFGFALPQGAAPETVRIQESDPMDIPRLVETDTGFGITAAVPPGETKVVFSYSVTGTGGTYQMSRPALYPTLDYALYLADPLRSDTDRLSERGQEVVGDRTYRVWRSGGALEAGDLIQAAAVLEGGMSPALRWGAGAGFAALATLVAVALWRRKQRTGLPRPPARATTRREAMIEIAELDLMKESGEIDEREWAQRRRSMKARLEKKRHPEPLP